ncbi:MAG: CHASE2 domain-containing protein [Proteobacteria bacterium]|nr:CHASE2 domain-containing protein [Cystobacterineae bacterium]MCL2258786.1 CHASE2 domain-containing protein [Cystobacterineae bacterium]MCL2314686.1 CHASE2 domain-containing protein [Pseudomonadota bacterium]
MRARFLRKLVVAFLWALGISGLASLLLYTRAGPSPEGGVAWVQFRLAQGLERLELRFFDFFSVAASRQAQRTPLVVLSGIDEQTLVNAREGGKPMLTVQPWPREYYGKVALQALQEGASQVWVEPLLSNASIRNTPLHEGAVDDDGFFAQSLRSAEGFLLSFGGSTAFPVLPEKPLRPFLSYAGTFGNLEESEERVGNLLRQNVGVFLFPKEGGWELWAGCESPEQAAGVLQKLGLKLEKTRRLEAEDTAFEKDAHWLFLRLAAVHVEGLDVGRLKEFRRLDIPLTSFLLRGVRFGFQGFEVDRAQAVRSVQHLVRYRDAEGETWVLPSAALVLAMRYLGTGTLKYQEGRLWLDGHSFPMDASGESHVHWDAERISHPERGTVKRYIPAWSILANAEAGAQSLHPYDNELSSKIFFLSEITQKNFVETPVGEAGVAAITAQALSNIVRQEGITRNPLHSDIGLTFAFGIAGSLLAVAYSHWIRNPRGWLSLGVCLAALGLEYWTARTAFLQQQLWLAVATPGLVFLSSYWSTLGYAVRLEQSIREFVLRALGSRSLGRRRSKRHQQVEHSSVFLSPEKKFIAGLCSNIEGFTGLVNKVPSAVLMKVMQEYLTDMTQVVLDTDGQPDKYLGEGMVAFWGAPIHVEEPVLSACEAACKMLEIFEKKRVGFEKQCGTPLVFRAGIDVGEALVGNMGTAHRQTYTVIGEPIATAAKLESLAFEYGAHVLCTELVAYRAQGKFQFRELDRIRWPRRDEPCAIFELLGSASAEKQEWLGRYKAALGFYYGRQFDLAKELFEKLSEETKDKVCTLYVQRAIHHMLHPPPEEWDGVFESS